MSEAKKCAGGGRPGKIDEATGFYSCHACGTVLGVVLGPIHRTPEHVALGANMVPVPDEGQRYVMKPEHTREPVCMAASRSGFSKDWTIDLLLRGVALLRAKVADLERREMKCSGEARIVLTGIDTHEGKAS